MKEALLILFIVSAIWGGFPKEHLPVNPGKYTLEVLKNRTEYHPVLKNEGSQVVSEITQGLIFGRQSNIHQVEYPSGEIREFGDKPDCKTSIPIKDKMELKFETHLSYLVEPFLFKYALINLGVQRQEYKMAFPSSRGFIKTLYFDQNCNGVIEKNEEFKALETKIERVYTRKERDGISVKELDYWEYHSRAEDIPVNINYIKSDGRVSAQKIYLSFYLYHKQKPDPNDPGTIHIAYEVRSYFAGVCTIYEKKRNTEKKFILVDKNNNGVFNDFNNDSLYIISQKGDKKEYKLKESYQRPGSGPVRVDLFTFPKCMAVVNTSDPRLRPEELEPDDIEVE